MPSKFYFDQLEYPVCQRDASSVYMRSPSKEDIQQFNKINNLHSPNSTLYPGQTLLIPSFSGYSDAAGATAMQSMDAVAFQFRNGPRAPNPKLFNQSFSSFLLAQSQDPGFWLGAGSTFSTLYLAENAKILNSIESDLGKLQTSIRRTMLAVPGKDIPKGQTRFGVHAPERDALRAKIKENMGKLQGNLQKKVMSASNGKDISDLSNKAIKKSFKANGKASEVKIISKTMDFADDAATKLKNGSKYLGRTLLVADALKTVYDTNKKVEYAKKTNPHSADLVRKHEWSKATGGFFGGYLGGEVGLAAGAGAVILFGTPVGWASIVVVGVAALAGGAVGGYLGKEAGSEAAERTLKYIEPSRKDEINMIVEGPEIIVP